MRLPELLKFTDPRPTNPANLKKTDIFVLIPFNSHAKGSPAGKSNNFIAAKAKETGADTYTVVGQWEFENTTPELELANVIGSRGKRHIKTREFLLRLNKLYPGRTLIIFAHSKHARRCRQMAIKLGFKVKLGDCTNSPYDKTGTQWWCRNPFIFFFWEALTRVHHLFKGWV